MVDGLPLACPRPRDVELMTSELVTNAVRHAGLGHEDTIRLNVDSDRDWVRVDVCEDGPGFKQAFPARSGPGGWGLVLVSLLADRWGSTYRGGESCVWFEVGPPRPGGVPAGPPA
jgi:two-component sensor histidine kinase